MNTKTRTRTITTFAAAIVIAGIGCASTAEAKTDTNGGGTTAVPMAEAGGIDVIVDRRKVRMAHDYVANAAARAEWARHH